MIACPLPSPKLTAYKKRYFDDGVLLYMHVTQDSFQEWLGFNNGAPDISPSGAITNIKGVTVYAEDILRNLKQKNRYIQEQLTTVIENKDIKITPLPDGTSQTIRTLVLSKNVDMRREAAAKILYTYGETLSGKQKELYLKFVDTVLKSDLFLKLKFKTGDMINPSAGGSYANYTNTVYLNNNILGTKYEGHVLAHELMHAFTLEPFGKLYNLGAKDSINLSVEELKKLFATETGKYFTEVEKTFLLNAVETFSKINKFNLPHYGATDAEEMIAELFTEPKFFSAVKEILIYFKKLLNSMANLYGFDAIYTEESLYKSTLDLIEEVAYSKNLVGGLPQMKPLIKNLEVEKEPKKRELLSKLTSLLHSISFSEGQNKYYQNGEEFGRLTELIKTKFLNKDIQSYAENTAKSIFKGQQKNTTDEKVNLRNPETLEEQSYSYEEVVKMQEKRYNELTARGRVIHLIIEKTLKNALGISTDEYDNMIMLEMEEKPDQYAVNPKSVKWVTGKEGSNLIKEWFKAVGFNFFETDVPLSEKDDLKSEVALVSKALGIGTRIDLLVNHFDDSFSIVDFKTGAQLFSDEMTRKIMSYGQNIPASRIEQAKFEVAVRAFMLKETLPEAKFKRLVVMSVSREEDRVVNIDMAPYLGALESYIRAEKPEIYQELKAKGMFHASEYYASSMPSDIAMESLSGNTVEEKFDAFKDHLLVQKLSRKNESFTTEENNVIDNTVTAFLEHSAGKRLTSDAPKEISILEKMIGNKYSASNPLVQAFLAYVDKVKEKARKTKQDYMEKHNKLHDAVLDEYYERNPGKRALNKGLMGGIVWFNKAGDGLFNFMWERNTVNDRPGWYFKTITEEMVKNKEHTQAEYNYNKFVRESMAEQFKKVMNTRLGNHYGKTRAQFEQIPFNELYAGFAPRIYPTGEEIVERHGAMSKEYLKYQKDRYMTSFLQNQFYNTKTNLGVPLKYLENDYNVPGAIHSFRADRMFEAFMTNLIFKDDLDKAYAIGEGLEVTLRNTGVKSFGGNAEHYKNTIAGLKDLIKINVQNIDVQESFVKDPIVINGKEVMIDKLMDLSRNYITNSTMILKPVTGTFNAALILMINLKRALGNSILGGAKAGDFTLKDFAFGIKEWTKLVADSMTGRLHQNKLYNLAEKLNFLPDNYDFALHSSNLPSAKNKLASKKYLFLFHSIGEDFGQYTALAAMMHRMQGSGNKNMWDMYGDNGDLLPDAKSRGLTKDGRELKGLTSEEVNKMKRVSSILHGGYRQDEKTALELSAVGRWALQFKKYLPSLLEGLFKSTYEDQYLGNWELFTENGKPVYKTITLEDGTTREEQVYEWVARLNEGRLRTLLGVFKYYIMASGNKDYKIDDEMKPERLRNLIDASLGMSFFISAVIAASLFFDDDDEETMLYKRYGRFAEDLSQGVWPFDLPRSLVQPFVTPKKLFDLAKASLDFFINGIILGERTQKGTIPGQWTLLRTIPFGSSYYDIKKNLIEFWDPD